MHWKSVWVNHTKTRPGPFHPKINMHKENEAYFWDGSRYYFHDNYEFLSANWHYYCFNYHHPSRFFLSLLFTNGWAFTSQNYDMFPGFILSTVAMFSFCHGIKKKDNLWIFNLTVLTFFLSNMFISHKSDFSELWVYIFQFWLLWVYIKNYEKKVRIMRYKLWIVRKSLYYQLYFIILLFNRRNKLPKEGDSADSY